MIRPTIEEIHEVMEEQGMKVFSNPYDCTLGWIRTNDNKSNKFNDWIFMSHPTENGGINSIIIPGTSDAGLYYREHPLNIDGTAIIQHGKQFRGSFTYMKKGGHRGQEAFRQTGGLDYWRDNNQDEYIDYINPQEDKDFRIGVNYKINTSENNILIKDLLDLLNNQTNTLYLTDAKDEENYKEHK
jgi:hypothetical protein